MILFIFSIVYSKFSINSKYLHDFSFLFSSVNDSDSICFNQSFDCCVENTDDEYCLIFESECKSKSSKDIEKFCEEVCYQYSDWRYCKNNFFQLDIFFQTFFHILFFCSIAGFICCCYFGFLSYYKHYQGQMEGNVVNNQSNIQESDQIYNETNFTFNQISEGINGYESSIYKNKNEHVDQIDFDQ